MTNSVVKTSETLPVFEPSAPESVRVQTATGTVRRRRNKKIEDAVFQYIRAMRILGAVRINTITIADALDLSQADVARAVSGLQDKGVRAIG